MREADFRRVMASPDYWTCKICEAQDGDKTAFEEIYRYFFPRMVAFFRQRRHPDAEDLAEEVLFRVWRHQARFDPQHYFETWIFRIARNVSLDDYRRAGRLVLESDFSDADGNPRDLGELAASDERQNPSLRLNTEDAAALVPTALASLPPRLRDVVELIDMKGFDFIHAAEILGVSVSTVRVSHSEALNRMFRFMAEARMSDAPSDGRRNKATPQERNRILSEHLSEIGTLGTGPETRPKEAPYERK
jgi:RNA polymerase sigma-70 factor, ECF subfamily